MSTFGLTMADVSDLDFRRRDIDHLLGMVLRDALFVAGRGAEGDFEWSCERGGPLSDRFIYERDVVILTLSHRDGRSFTWNVEISFRQLALRDETAIANNVCAAAAALVWRFYRPRFRIGTRRRAR